MRRSVVTFEDLNRVLPAIEELEDLRLGIVGVAVLDPAKEWDDSRAYATIDKRVVNLEQVTGVLSEVEASFQEFTTSFFSNLRPLLAAICDREYETAARHLTALGDQYEAVGRHAQAMRYFESALQILEALPERQNQILVLRQLARSARAVGELDRSQLYYRRSAEIARDVEDVEAEAVALTGYGNILAVQGRWPAAEEVYTSALRRADLGPEGERLPLVRGQLYINLGLVASRQGRFDEAEEWLERAAQMREVMDSLLDRALCNYNLAQLRVRQDRRTEALVIFEATLNLALPPGVRATLAATYAESLLQEGRVADAVRWGREAEEQAIRARSPYSLAEMYQVLGNIARERGAEDGFTFYEKAIQLAQEKGYTLLEGETLVDYARLRTRMGGREEALSYVHRAIDIFQAIGAQAELERAREVLEELTVEQLL